jgi:hypothetical protein
MLSANGQSSASQNDVREPRFVEDLRPFRLNDMLQGMSLTEVGCVAEMRFRKTEAYGPMNSSSPGIVHVTTVMPGDMIRRCGQFLVPVEAVACRVQRH